MIDLSSLSSRYRTRILDDSDVDMILELCRGNPQFYEYARALPTAEQICTDMKLTPPGIGPEDKYYFGFFEERDLFSSRSILSPK